MAIRGFSKFEQMFRAKLAAAAPLEVLRARKKGEGLTAEEVGAMVVVVVLVVVVVVSCDS